MKKIPKYEDLTIGPVGVHTMETTCPVCGELVPEIVVTKQWIACHRCANTRDTIIIINTT